LIRARALKPRMDITLKINSYGFDYVKKVEESVNQLVFEAEKTKKMLIKSNWMLNRNCERCISQEEIELNLNSLHALYRNMFFYSEAFKIIFNEIPLPSERLNILTDIYVNMFKLDEYEFEDCIDHCADNRTYYNSESQVYNDFVKTVNFNFEIFF
jgi:hypothetical protein